ncbi:MAG: glycosyltransferase [Phycisphaerae bacterium]|nr:glycosyltransferase [Phycisphaerae bacterium]
MKIVHYLRQIRLNQGGVVRAVLDFCHETAAAGHRVTWLTYDPADAPKAWLDPDSPREEGKPGVPLVVPIPRARLPGQLFDRAGLSAIEAHVRGADVVHLHGIWTPSNSQVARLCRRHARPYVVTPHGMLDDWPMHEKRAKKFLYFRFVTQPFLHGAAFVHCTAQAELAQASTRFPKGRGAVVHLPFDLTPYRSPASADAARARFPVLANGKPNVLFLSRLHKKKGLDVLIRAAGVLARRGPDFNLVVSGPGSAEETEVFRGLARECGVEGRAHFLGFITPEEKFQVYRAADLFALPTHMENFGYVFFEALASELPVVTTRVDTWPELTESGGALIVPQTPEAFADAMQGLLADPARRRAMGRAGRAWVHEHLNTARVLRELTGMYERAVAWQRTRGG